MSETVNPMAMPRIVKVVVNIGVGEGGDRLTNAEKVLKMVTGVSPIRTLGKQQNRDLKVRVGFPIGCKVTMRDSESIKKFLTDAFWVRETQFQGGISTNPEIFLSVSVITLISQNKNMIQISVFMEWT